MKDYYQIKHDMSVRLYALKEIAKIYYNDTLTEDERSELEANQRIPPVNKMMKGHEYSPPGVNSIPHLLSELSDSV